MVDNARDLFLDQGFAATSTRQIAAAAGVTERTLFNIVANKGELLRQVMLAHVFGGDDGPLTERADFAEILDCDSAGEFLHRFAGWVAALHQRSARLAEMVRAAASVDAGAARLWDWGVGQQSADCRRIIRVFREHGWLRAGITAPEAADSLAVLSGHETYWRLVTERHWRLPRYRRWLERHCSSELVG